MRGEANLFSFADFVVEHSKVDSDCLVLRERRYADFLVTYSPINIGDFHHMDLQQLPEDERRAVQQVEAIVSDALPDEEVRVWLLRFESCMIFKYDDAVQAKEYVKVVGSQGCAKSFIAFLMQTVAGNLAPTLDPSQVNKDNDLNRRAILQKGGRVYVVHEGKAINPMMLKAFWVAQDQAGTRAGGSGKFTSRARMGSGLALQTRHPRLMSLSNTEDLSARPCDDVLQKTILMYELDIAGKRVLGKGVKTEEDLYDSDGEKRPGYFTMDKAIRTKITDDPKMATALARVLVHHANSAENFDAERACPPRVLQLRDRWNQMRGDGQKLIDLYENKGFPEGAASVPMDMTTPRVEIVSHGDADTIDEARERLVRAVAEQVVEVPDAAVRADAKSGERAIITYGAIRPSDVLRRIQELCTELVWAGIGGEVGVVADSRSVKGGPFLLDIKRRFAWITNREWVVPKSRTKAYNHKYVIGEHMYGVALRAIVASDTSMVPTSTAVARSTSPVSDMSDSP